MAKPVLNFSKLSIGAKILRIRQIVLATTGNSVYTTPSPTLAAITTAVDQLEEDQLAMKDGGTSATTIRNAQADYVMGMMNEFLAYVTIASGGDQIKIESTTLAVRKMPSKQGIMSQVLSLAGKAGLFPGDVILKWKAIAVTKYYYLQKSADGLTNWANEGEPCTKSTVTVSGLVPETASFFRVSAGNVQGLGPYSSPVRVMSK